MSRNRAYLILAGCLFTLPVLCGVFGFTNVLSQKAKSPRSSWMKDASDDTAIEDLDIVGSHESLALYGIGDLAGQCQSLPIGEQLELGVRLFDIRLKVSGASLHAYHGFVDERQKFFRTDVFHFIPGLGEHRGIDVLFAEPIESAGEETVALDDHGVAGGGDTHVQGVCLRRLVIEGIDHLHNLLFQLQKQNMA